jgi:choice-of-anchor A domain-containing protein
LIVNPFPNATLLINVPGEHPTQQYGMKYNGSDAHSTAYGKILFNYNEAQTLVTSNMLVLGSVLAPYADLTINSGGINGVGIANNVLQTNGGEFHNYTFTGDLPSPPVPEPGTTIMLILGAVGMIVAGRKR